MRLILIWSRDQDLLQRGLILTRSVLPTTALSALPPLPPSPPLLPHPPTGPPVGQTWGCAPHRPPPGRGRCCASSLPLSHPRQVTLECYSRPLLSWTRSCSQSHYPELPGPCPLDCCHSSPAGLWLLCLLKEKEICELEVKDYMNKKRPNLLS